MSNQICPKCYSKFCVGSATGHCEKDRTSVLDKPDGVPESYIGGVDFSTDWEDEFRQFYFEEGKYIKRELGFDAYIRFIRQVLDSKLTKQKVELLSKIKYLGCQENVDIITVAGILNHLRQDENSQNIR